MKLENFSDLENFVIILNRVKNSKKKLELLATEPYKNLFCVTLESDTAYIEFDIEGNSDFFDKHSEDILNLDIDDFDCSFGDQYGVFLLFELLGINARNQ